MSLLKPSSITAFLSCSFQADDSQVNGWFLALCNGLAVNCVNVGQSTPNSPPTEARNLIKQCALLICIATRRERLEDGTWAMPSAVREEISMAYGLHKPILLFAEQGVRVDGMMDKFCSFIQFSRDELNSPDVIQRVVTSLYSMRRMADGDYQPTEGYQPHPYYAESVRVLVELENATYGFTWRYVVTKKLRFTAAFQQTIKTAVWPAIPADAAQIGDKVAWSLDVGSGSRDFTITPTIFKHSVDTFDASLRITPEPKEGDWIEYTTISRSPFLNPVFADQVPDVPTIRIGDKQYVWCDGFLPIHQVQSLKIQFRFPRNYGLSCDDFHPAVGSYSTSVNYILQNELDRLSVIREKFDGPEIAVAVENPLLGHFYGVAWDPPERHDEGNRPTIR